METPMPNSGEGNLTRRDLLHKAFGFGGITVVSSFSAASLIDAWAAQAQQTRKLTPPNDLGPFYKKRAPENPNMRDPRDPGLPLAVSGGVYNEKGEILHDATVEVWHTDHLGHYDLEGYRYRAKLHPNAKGKYAFNSVIPGHYPDRVCQHIHYLVTAPGHKPLITQLYFATDPVFEGNPDKNFTRDPLIHTRELVRPVMLTGDPKDVFAAVQFELVLAKA
jgi:protocatechuate 3,4-dioxygenase beta subunit